MQVEVRVQDGREAEVVELELPSVELIAAPDIRLGHVAGRRQPGVAHVHAFDLDGVFRLDIHLKPPREALIQPVPRNLPQLRDDNVAFVPLHRQANEVQNGLEHLDEA